MKTLQLSVAKLIIIWLPLLFPHLAHSAEYYCKEPCTCWVTCEGKSTSKQCPANHKCFTNCTSGGQPEVSCHPQGGASSKALTGPSTEIALGVFPLPPSNEFGSGLAKSLEVAAGIKTTVVPTSGQSFQQAMQKGDLDLVLLPMSILKDLDRVKVVSVIATTPLVLIASQPLPSAEITRSLMRGKLSLVSTNSERQASVAAIALEVAAGAPIKRVRPPPSDSNGFFELPSDSLAIVDIGFALQLRSRGKASIVASLAPKRTPASYGISALGRMNGKLEDQAIAYVLLARPEVNREKAEIYLGAVLHYLGTSDFKRTCASFSCDASGESSGSALNLVRASAAIRRDMR